MSANFPIYLTSNSSLHDRLINKFFPSPTAVLSAREFVETSGSNGG
jgi:hypothetical protein